MWPFILWFTVQQKLSTKDRLASWSMRVDDNSVLCTNDKESHPHLFFEYPFSALWIAVCARIPNPGISCRLMETGLAFSL